MNKVLECIPNFSEGNDESELQHIANAIRSVEGVWLLHIDQSPAANRTVITFAGNPESVIEAAYRAIKIAAEYIDMSSQQGVHPRIGATDVCPLVPLYGMTMEEADNYAQQLATRVGVELNIPVYLYEYSQPKTYRKALPDIRKGQYEGLADKMKLADWQPDFGPHEFSKSAGATVIGARNILVAFNISLQTKDIQVAHWIAQRLRESGYTEMVNGERHRIAGKLAKVRAIGWYMADYEQAQVSFNLLDYRETSPLAVWQTCKELAAEQGVSLVGSEVIGLIPEACLIEAGSFALNEYTNTTNEHIIPAAIEYLGLNKLKPFDPHEKILEWVLSKHL